MITLSGWITWQITLTNTQIAYIALTTNTLNPHITNTWIANVALSINPHTLYLPSVRITYVTTMINAR